jgi:hypothetical protein
MTSGFVPVDDVVGVFLRFRRIVDEEIKMWFLIVVGY